jgi:hypothetical protein
VTSLGLPVSVPEQILQLGEDQGAHLLQSRMDLVGQIVQQLLQFPQEKVLDTIEIRRTIVPPAFASEFLKHLAHTYKKRSGRLGELRVPPGLIQVVDASESKARIVAPKQLEKRPEFPKWWCPACLARLQISWRNERDSEHALNNFLLCFSGAQYRQDTTPEIYPRHSS